MRYKFHHVKVPRDPPQIIVLGNFVYGDVTFE